jgi:hypothetical protein
MDMAQREPDSTERRLEVLTDRFDDFVDATHDFIEETRRNREADTKKFDDFVEETRANRQADTKKLDDFMKEVRDDFARLNGREYERYVSHTLLSPVSRRLGLRRPRLAHSAAYGTSDELSIRLEDLMEQHDLLDVVLSDAIVRGTHEGEPAYAVVEISLTIGNRDITRAADRAARLESATGVKTFAVAIGEHIPTHQETRANAMNVTLIQIAE